VRSPTNTETELDDKEGTRPDLLLEEDDLDLTEWKDSGLD
jgi:hypothetical protein